MGLERLEASLEGIATESLSRNRRVNGRVILMHDGVRQSLLQLPLGQHLAEARGKGMTNTLCREPNEVLASAAPVPASPAASMQPLFSVGPACSMSTGNS